MIRRTARLGAAAAAAMASGACALPPADLHLAPLYSHHRLAAGGYSHEALGGILEARAEERLDASTVREWAIRPLVRHRSHGERREMDVLWPFGRFGSDEIESAQRFFPFWWWQSRPNQHGVREVDWMLLPFLFGGSGTPDNTYFAFFPFGGTLRDYFSYDRITFYLFPFYGETVKSPGDQRGYGILVPFVGWGGDETGASWWKAWPFFGVSKRPDRYERYFAAWPFWHSEENYAATPHPSTDWMLFPLYGEVDQGAFHARSLLWPFFGWDWNDETGYSAWEAPWPFVRVLRNGQGRPFEETRFLPFYAHYRGFEIDSTAIPWPLVWIREETAGGLRRSSFHVVPFLYTAHGARELAPADAERLGVTSAGESTDLVWPFYREETNADGSALAETLFPMPWPSVDGFRENWFPFYSLFSSARSAGGAVSDRLWLDLFRRESSFEETRWSIPVLGGHRTTSDGISEWSLLLGLVRWRSGRDGTSLLLPAIPGPGFEPLPRAAADETAR